MKDLKVAQNLLDACGGRREYTTVLIQLILNPKSND